MASAAWLQTSRGETPEPIMSSLMNGRKSRRMAKW